MPSLTEAGCLGRQDRFRRHLEHAGLDAALISDYRDIYYFTGNLFLPPGRFPAALLIETQGKTLLFAHQAGGHGIDEAATYQAAHFATLNSDKMRRLEAVMAQKLPDRAPRKRLGYQAEEAPHLLLDCARRALQCSEMMAIDEILDRQQQRKDPDELELMRLAIRADLAAYDAVRKAIYPGANELEVLAAGQRGAQLFAGEQVDHSGDYQSGKGGGPARNRAIETGELYIIDAWTCYRGYWSDLSRAYIVGGSPTDEQQALYNHVAQAQSLVPGLLRPGATGGQVWQQLDQFLREFPPLADKGLAHHAGHAVGLRVHMEPDLNHDRVPDHVLQAGNVLSVEPAGYLPNARAGVRLENMYLVTERGCELLSDYPLEILA